MKLIVGLGNPGKEYEKQRHNAGFLFLDWLTGEESLNWSLESRFNSEVASWSTNEEKVLLVKPQTFMNESGEAVQSLISYYKLSPADVLLVHDDVDIPLGEFREVYARGAAGHHGVESVQDRLKTSELQRIRLGIGRPEGEQKVESYVLEDFTPTQREKLESIYPHVRESIFLWLKNPLG